MDSPRWTRIEELFHAASAMSPAEREAFLARTCEGDEPLRQEVLSLLDADGAGDSILHAELGRAAATVVGAKEAAVGDRIGTYRVLRPLGRGGMGEVYLAERADDSYHKQVAIKLVRAGFGTEESLRRFRAERQILAKLEHAHIARLLDGGSSETGQPYVVMEYVDGKPLLEYCREKQLSLRARLGLFQQICGAVQYAHQNLIVHRDIKPGNVLVNAEGVAKLVDFGIAKLLGDDPIASTQTQSFERLLTPEYASPEQVTGEPISTASDVYSLGALLYELLTQKPPLQIPARTALEIERVITTEEPQPPSVRSGNHALAGDLDTITLMALRKEQARRYTSAAALAEDIQRYLDGYPIQARQEGMLYRARKFVRRNRIGVAAAAVFAALLAGFVVTVIRERNTAERERVKAEQVSKFLVKSFELADPSEARGKQVTAREILEQGLTRLDTELRGQPEVQSTLMTTISEVYFSLGLMKDSLELNDRAMAQTKTAGMAESVQMADLLTQRAYVLRENGQYKPAKEHASEALAMLRKVAPGDEDRRASYLRSYGPLLNMMGESAAAEKILREALALRRRISGDNHEETVWNLANLSRVLTDQGKYKEALAPAEEALQLALRLHGPVHETVNSAYNRIGVVQYWLRNLDASEQAFRKGIETGRKLYGTDTKDIASNLNGLASVLNVSGKHGEAADIHRQSIAIFRKVYGGNHPVLAQSLGSLSISLHNHGEHEEEFGVAEEGVNMAMAVGGKDNARYANALGHMARVYADKGDFRASGKAYEEAYRFRAKVNDAKNETTLGYLYMMSSAWRVTGRCGEAEPMLREADELTKDQTAPVQKTQRGEVRTLLAACLFDRGQREAAEKLLRDVLANEADSALKSRLFPVLRYHLGRALLAGGKAAEAEPLLQAAHATYRKPAYNALERGLANLEYARCLRALGRGAQASSMDAEARKSLLRLAQYPIVSASLRRP